MSSRPKPKEHPLANILINVLIPVMALSHLSKDPAMQQALGKAARFWHVGPTWAMVIALALPLGYGVWHFIRSRQANFFSILGVVSVLLTGGLTIYLWNANGTVKPHAGLMFGIKEALIPMMLGIAVWLSHRGATPLIRVFLYNDTIFDIAVIERKVAELGVEAAYRRVLLSATHLFAISFFLSSAMNLVLAQWFFRGFDPSAPDALVAFNEIVGRVMLWGFAVIGVPILVFLFLTLRQLLTGLRKVTGLSDEQLLLPR